MFCPSCGASLPATARFCSTCGATVSVPLAASLETANQPSPVLAAATGAAAVNSNAAPPPAYAPGPVPPRPAALPPTLKLKLVKRTTTLTTVWKGRLLLILWIVAMLVTGVGYQFGLRESFATLVVWGVPTVLALVVSCLLVDWKSPGERNAQLYWLIVIPILSVITILAFNVPAMNRFLEFGLLTWSVALSIGYIANGLAVRWPLMVRAGAWSLLFVLFYLNPALEPYSYGFFGISHAGVMALLASS